MRHSLYLHDMISAECLTSYLSNFLFKVDDVDTVPKNLPPQTIKRNSIFHQPGSEWNRGKRVSISYTTQQTDIDSPHRPRKV